MPDPRRGSPQPLSLAAVALAVCATASAAPLIAFAAAPGLALAFWRNAIGAAGAVLATGADVGVSGRAVIGDLLAAAGAIAGAVYTALGERARIAVSTVSYTAICYGVCALVLLATCLAGGVATIGFDAASWLAILGLAAGPQLLGHSMFNYALRRVSATTVSVVLLLEVPGSALLAWAWLGQTPRPATLPGLALLVIGVAVVILGAGRTGAKVPPPD